MARSLSAWSDWLAAMLRDPLARRPLAAALAAAALILLAWGLAGLGGALPADDVPFGSIELNQAVGRPASGDDGAAKPLKLPAMGSHLPLDADGRALISLRFDRPDELPPEQLLAAHLAATCGRLDIDLNGTALQRDVEPGAARAQLCPRPRIVTLPSTLLQPLGNRLDIRIHGVELAQTSNARRAAYLSTVLIGPQQQLQRKQAMSELVHVGLPRLIQVGLFVLGGIVLLLSRAGHHVTLLRLYGLMVLLWSVLLGLVVWADRLPLPAEAFDTVLVTMWTPTMALAMRLLLSLCGRDPQWLFRLLAVQGLLLPLGLIFAPADMQFTWANGWAVVLVLQALAVFAVYLADRWRREREEFWFGLATWALMIAAWTVDGVWTPADLPAPMMAAWIAGSPFGWAVLAAVTGVRIVTSLNRALIAAEASRAMLQTRVLDVTAVVERNFAQLAEMRIAQTTERERKRIASDLHDDLGAKLLTIVHTCGDERIAALGRDALDEMRLAVRGLSSKPMPLGDAIADWRAEIMQRLGQVKTRLDWHSSGELAEHALNARAYVQITRILREAVSNIVKHSHAARCRVAFRSSGGHLALDIEDDGCGLPDGADQALLSGHGLSGMKQRANQLDGECTVESVPGRGTAIRVRLPL